MRHSKRNCWQTGLLLDNERLHYFYINDGPWSRLDNNEPFIEGVPKEKPPQAAYYPDDIHARNSTRGSRRLSEADKQKATGFFYRHSAWQ